MLRIGDYFGKDCSRILPYPCMVDASKFCVEGLIKPNAGTIELPESVFNLTREYDHQNFVVFMFNERSVSNLLSLKTFLRCIFPISKFINLLISSDFSKYSYYLNFINDSIQKYHHLNRNISIKHKNRLKVQNVRQAKMIACVKLRNFRKK